MVVHWDGKLMTEIVGSSKFERIAILLSFNGTSKFLSATSIDPGTGENIAIAVRDALISWNIIDRVGGMSFDTTASNTGPNSSATMFLQQFMDRKLIELACRHHIYEIVLRGVFESKHGTSSAPEVLIFNRFQRAWPGLDHSSFKSGLEDEIVRSKISDTECEIIKRFCKKQLALVQIREDYRELLELTLTFLGETGFNFRTCSNTSHARFMAKGIYSLKMLVFRDQFHFTARELNGLRDVCIFLVRIYIKVWYGSTTAIQAPNQDLNFIKDAIAFAETDQTASEVALSKFKNHLWYLTPETTALAFFDPDVPLEEKRKMVERLQSAEPIVKLAEYRKFLKNPRLLLHNTLSDFVSYKTKHFFVSFGLSSDFFEFDPSTWTTNVDYLDALECCRELSVVNDTAERGVRFMKEYNKLLTKSDEQFQLILQLVEGYRKKYPSYKKSALT